LEFKWIIKPDILKLKEKLPVTIVGHFYQRDEVFELADITGDSLELAEKPRMVKPLCMGGGMGQV